MARRCSGMIGIDTDYGDAKDYYADNTIRLQDQIPTIFICATMWHETEEEMLSVLKSFFKWDIGSSLDHLNTIIMNVNFYEIVLYVFFLFRIILLDK